MAELDNISKLQSYEDYIANNITQAKANDRSKITRFSLAKAGDFLFCQRQICNR